MTVQTKAPIKKSVTPILDNMLARLAPYYLADDVEEITINRPGEVWLKKRVASSKDKPKAQPVWMPTKDQSLTLDYLKTLLFVIANTYDRDFGPKTEPTLYATLPGGHRFSGIAGANVIYDEETPEGGVAIALRQARGDRKSFNFDAWGLAPGQDLPRSFIQSDDPLPMDMEPYERYLHAVRTDRDILISGATSTGKTEFLNRTLEELSLDERIITVEDTRELKINNPNRVHLLLSRTEQLNRFNYPKAIDLVKRFTPDRTIAGEVSSTNAEAIYQLCGTGHGSMMCTIHAKNPEEAKRAFINCMKQCNSQTNEEDVRAKLDKFVIVQIERHGSERRVTAVE